MTLRQLLASLDHLRAFGVNSVFLHWLLSGFRMHLIGICIWSVLRPTQARTELAVAENLTFDRRERKIL